MSLSTDEQTQVLMDINKLSYSPVVDGSLANRRQLRKYAFQPLGYNSGQIAQHQVQSGGDYINGPGSYIVLDFNPLVANSKWVENADEPGSAFNIFNEWQHTHRSGDVLDRTSRLNVLVSILLNYISLTYRSFIGSLVDNGSAEELEVDSSYTYVYPLFLFSGLFAQKALIPSMLMAGSNIKIQLEDKALALVGGATSDYSVSNMYLVLDSVSLFDGAQKVLMEQAANVKTGGLQFSYYSYFHLSKPDAGTSINMDINYSAAKNIHLLVKKRLTEDQVITKNSMKSAEYKYSAWRIRLGALTFPEFEVRNSRESYQIAVNSFGKSQNCDLLESSMADTGITHKQYKATDGVICQTLDKNPIVALSSEPTNNARLLNFSGTVTAANRSYDAYIKHLRVVNIMMDNVVVNR